MKNNKNWLIILVFFVSLIFHLIGINQAGRTWDEQFKVDLGYLGWDRLIAGDYSVESWSSGTEHPMIGKYIYGAFLPANSIRINEFENPTVIRNDFTEREISKLSQYKFITSQIRHILLAVDYDWTWIRSVSGIFNSLALAGVFIIACWFIPEYWSLLAPLSLLFSPRFLAMGKQITFESITAALIVWTVIAFAWLLKNQNKLLPYLVVGIGCGMLIFTRYNNVYVFILLIGWWFIHQISQGKKNLTIRILNWRFVIIPIISILFGYLTWPLIWHEFPKYLISSIMENSTRSIGPTLYYVKNILITTPVIWLISLFYGIYIALKKRSEKSYFIVWWLLSSILIFSIFGINTGGLRYIFFFYPAAGVLTSIGLYTFLNKYKYKKYIIFLLIIYGIWLSISIHPYYLDYYNEIVGGVSGADKIGAEISYWGEGQRETGLYLNKIAKNDASVAMLVTPFYVMPPLRPDLKFIAYGEFSYEDYVIVSRYDLPNYIDILNNSYKQIYSAKAGGVSLVSLWEKIH